MATRLATVVIITLKSMFRHRKIEYATAVTSFIAAIVFAFTSLYLSTEHEVAAGNCTIIAQFLILTASIFGIDYKLNNFGHTLKSGHKDPSVYAQNT